PRSRRSRHTNPIARRPTFRTGTTTGRLNADFRRRVDSGQPAFIERFASGDDTIVDLPQPAGDRSNRTVADDAAVDRGDVADAGRGSGKEDLVGAIELAAIDRAFDDLEPQLAACHVHDRAARDAFEHVLR